MSHRNNYHFSIFDRRLSNIFVKTLCDIFFTHLPSTNYISVLIGMNISLICSLDLPWYNLNPLILVLWTPSTNYSPCFYSSCLQIWKPCTLFFFFFYWIHSLRLAKRHCKHQSGMISKGGQYQISSPVPYDLRGTVFRMVVNASHRGHNRSILYRTNVCLFNSNCTVLQ